MDGRLFYMIEQGLKAGRSSNDSLATWVRGHDARDSVRSDAQVIREALDALEKLRHMPSPQTTYYAPEYDRVERCSCQDPNGSPPCSYCTRPRDEDE
jgi:hypothetical protein